MLLALFIYKEAMDVSNNRDKPCPEGFRDIVGFTNEGVMAHTSSEFAHIVPEGAEVELIATGFEFTEGPAVDAEGNLFFTDIRKGQINKLSTAGELSNFRTDIEAKANGLFFDSQGRLVVCEGGNGRVTRIELDGTITVLADEFNGNRFNSPNDLFIAADGSIYFTDPTWSSTKPQPLEGVYRIALDGTVTLVVDDINKHPNGVFMSQEGETLYIADDGAGVVRAYSVEADGTVKDGRLFANMPGVSDGMTLDVEGNLYVAGGTGTSEDRGVWVFDSTGTKLGVIQTPQIPTNCTLSGNALYITAGTSVYSIRLNVAGVGQATVEKINWGYVKAKYITE